MNNTISYAAMTLSAAMLLYCLYYLVRISILIYKHSNIRIERLRRRHADARAQTLTQNKLRAIHNNTTKQ
jgi:hypothetical protein